ncbi:Protein CBG27554 [Caenorhabditis briggsae]|uniref:RNA-directed DNA polymerase n=1 Tax=Caenorhabditis briggsae TaxID=6238 RepID=B6IKL8_CAEBR|nr:Protein CBG27554 [Caenorhabditis briggsae]CAS00448.1 Protein CBG27554 [Caenorhabditis briggsae]
MFNDRIVIPSTLKARVLKMIHRDHPGIVRMKQLARSLVYWPSIDKDIENKVRSCDQCASVAKNPIKNTLCSWPIPTAPWQRVHADYAGPLDGTYYLVVVDAFSKWPEVFPTTSITTTATINILRKVFSQFGDPQTLVTDNGTQFTSSGFENFCKDRGITHSRSPAIPSTIKWTGRTAIALRLVPPVQMAHHPLRTSLAGRSVHSWINFSQPTNFPTRTTQRWRSSSTTSMVHVAATSTWEIRTIQRRIGRTMYRVTVENNNFWIRHTNQLRRRDTPTSFDVPLDTMDTMDAIDWTPLSTTLPDSSPTTPAPILPGSPTAPSPKPIRKSTRTGKPPPKFAMKPNKKSYH